ncbi:CoA transferase [Achromobacter aegrifaciens]
MANSRPLPHLYLPRLAPGGRLELLRGIRVLDLTSSIAGPYATMLLADLGADIVKIERPDVGDDSRYWRPPELDGNALWFSSVNRNKRSLTLDYSREEGRKVLMELVRKSDVVVTNQLPQVQAKLGPTSHVHRTHPTRRVRRHHHQPRGGAQCPELRHVTRDRPGARRGRSCGRPALFFTGAGHKVFCAGADIGELMGRSIPQEYAGTRLGQDLYSRIESFRIPSVAIVNGYALGGGCELAMACSRTRWYSFPGAARAWASTRPSSWHGWEHRS